MVAFTGEVHPAADEFPMMCDDELAELATDIADHGLKSPIVLDGDGRLVDGRNRLAACRRAEVAPKFVTYQGENVVSFIASVNIKRRHLTASQKAMAAEALLPHLEDEARLRKVAAGREHGRGGKVRADLPGPNSNDELRARDEAAKATGASPRNIQKAKFVADNAPDLAEEVKAGTKSVNAAEKEARARVERAKEGLKKTDPEFARLAANSEIANARKYLWDAKSILHMDRGFIVANADDRMHRSLAGDIDLLRRWCDELEAALAKPLAPVLEIQR